ncbi:hypothetical protein V2J09_004489 [Rumex salicifolius]
MSEIGARRATYSQISSSSEKGSIRDDEKSSDVIIDDKLFVAVGKDVKENKSTVIWALQNRGGKKIWILHVHTPAKMIPILGGKFPVNQVGKKEVLAYHEKERKEMHKAIDEYVKLCAKAGASVEKLVFEADSIENGIITLISQKKIGRLSMGAAADNRYKKNMMELKSKKAIYVRLQAPTFCHISFTCNGYLINTREGLKPQYPNSENGDSNSFRSRSVIDVSGCKDDIDLDKYKSRSVGVGGVIHDTADWLIQRRDSESDRPSTSSEEVRDSPLSLASNINQGSNELALRMSHERSMHEDLYDQLDALMKEADNLKEEAYLESMKRRKAEMDFIDAIRKAKGTESLYYEEQKRRKELEEKLAKEKEELETIKSQNAKALEQLQAVLHQNLSLVKELDKCNKERDELEIQHNNALFEVDRLRRQQAILEPTSTQTSMFFVDFTLSEIAEATDNFSLSRKIGEGGFGKTYKGLLRHAEVAIKVLDPDSVQGPQEFKQEVDALSKLRHPNIVTLVGVCSEASAIVYEYLHNGSLEDRLCCKDNTPPLSWQTRIQIATELCSVLMFLHSSQPESIIHSDLKPANILLDSYLSCKVSDFGICRSVSNKAISTDNMTGFCLTEPKGTFAYMDPEFVSTGELTLKSDIYSFGVILLRLLTGRSPFGLTREVQCAVDRGDLRSALDGSAGDWPVELASQLAVLALGCCELQRNNRPDLVEDVWTVLEPMRVSAWNCSLTVYMNVEEP